jgi:hypothetical protein
MTYAARVSETSNGNRAYSLLRHIQAAVKHGEYAFLRFFGVFSGVLICLALMLVGLISCNLGRSAQNCCL